MSKRVEHIGDATLYLGDCRDLLPALEADALITDPPYGVKAVAGMGGGRKGDGGMYAGVSIVGDQDTALRDEVLTCWHPKAFAVLGAPSRAYPIATRMVLCWDKGGHTGAGDLSLPWKPCFDLIFIGGKGWRAERRSSGVVRFNAVAGCVAHRNDGYRWHPFEKPLDLMCHLVERAPGVTVLDPFMGSGTTGVAALRLGRKFVGIEIDERWFDNACRRIEAEARQLKLFEMIDESEERTTAREGGLDE